MHILHFPHLGHLCKFKSINISYEGLSELTARVNLISAWIGLEEMPFIPTDEAQHTSSMDRYRSYKENYVKHQHFAPEKSDLSTHLLNTRDLKLTFHLS